jgi:hypothetical protein
MRKSEVEMLDSLLKAINKEIDEQSWMLENQDDCYNTFTIVVGSTASQFLVGGPQVNALYNFIQHIADENGYNVDVNNSTVTE